MSDMTANCCAEKSGIDRAIQLFALLACLFALPSCGGEFDNQERRRGDLRIELSGELISVDARDVTVHRLLREIAVLGGIELVSQAPLTSRVTIEFEKYELPDAIERILPAQSFTLYSAGYPTDKKYPAGFSPGILWVYAVEPATIETLVSRKPNDPVENGSNPGDMQISADQLIATSHRALVGLDVAARIDAVDSLAELRSDEAIATLAIALHDSESSVREEAVDALGDIGDQDNILLLAPVLNDVDEDVREAAVDAITEIGGDVAIDLLRQSAETGWGSVRD